MEPIRILHIVTYMGRGGLETMLMNYYRNIDRSKIQFDFLVHRDFRADYDDEIESLGGIIYRIKPLNPFSFSYYKELYNFFKSHKYEIVHCHLDCMSAVPLFVAKLCKIKIRIAHSHNASQDKNIKYFIKILTKKFIPKTATDLFSCGKSAGKWMFSRNQFTILNNAIDTNKFIYNENISNTIKKNLSIEGYFIIGHIGRFNPQKNHFYLIDIFYELTKLDSNVKLLLIGAGPLLENIKNKINELQIIDNVVFLDTINNVHKVIQTFDVFLFPSLYEGFPVTSIEAQTAGLPCILSDTITSDCKITDNVEFLSLNESPEVWAKEILKYKNHKKSNNSEKIIQAGYDIKENAKWLENYYINKVNIL